MKPWLSSEIKLIKERGPLGVPTTNLVRELNRRFSMGRSFQQVAAVREMILNGGEGLLLQDSIVDPDDAPVTPAVKSAVSERRSLSAASVKRPAKRLTASLKEVAKTGQNGDAKDEAKPEARQIKIDFIPAYVTACVAGKSYVHATAGPMECTGLSTQTVAGFEIELITLKELHGGVTPVILQIQPSKFPKDTIRELASREVMEKILHKLEFGLSDLKFTARGKDLASFLKERAESQDITVVTDVLCFTHGHSRKGAELTTTSLTYGEKAMRRIASECAVVMKMDYEAAIHLVKKALGIAKQDVAPETAAGAPKAPGL